MNSQTCFILLLAAALFPLTSPRASEFAFSTPHPSIKGALLGDVKAMVVFASPHPTFERKVRRAAGTDEMEVREGHGIVWLEAGTLD